MGRGAAGGRWWLTLSALIVLAASPGRGSDVVRPSALAGGWYPSDPETLAAYVDAALGAADPCRPCGEIRALVVPHAGYRYSGATAAAAFALVQGRSFKRVLLLAPSHRSAFHGLSIANVTAYETPLGGVPLDREVVAGLRASPLVSADPMAHTAEHAIEIDFRNSVSYLGLVATLPPKASQPPEAGNPPGVSGPAAVRDEG